MIKRPPLLLSALLICSLGPADAAHYVVKKAGGGGALPVTDAWVTAQGQEDVRGRHLHWWRMDITKPDGAVLAIRALSERVPMTSASGPGRVERYIYSPGPGIVLEYVDSRTGRALLPELAFEDGLLPRPSPDCAYVGGFADTGALLGHLLQLADDEGGGPGPNLDDPKRLVINTDFIIGTSRSSKDDGVMAAAPDWDWNFVPLTEADVRAQIEAGFNYFSARSHLRPWVENEAVFVAGTPIYPDDLYRSNFSIRGMFLDEPMVRLGWDGGLPLPARGPELIAQALRMKVAAEDSLTDRLFVPPGISMGTLEILRGKRPAWETEYWSAWYQLQAGASGIVHEGRYKHRGYGWEPESLLGPGLDGLTDRDQFNFIFAFLRGAARSFDGDWGTSLYGHSDTDLRVPAFVRAYEMGAKYLWFWTSDHEHHMPFSGQLRIAAEITEYARRHPRPDRESLRRSADVGIALPPGYAFNWNGTWGMERERTNRFGVSYGDISTAAFWEGLLCSRRGIEYDFLVDHPGIDRLGYERIVYVREDGSTDVAPPWPAKRAPSGLRMTIAPAGEEAIDVDTRAMAEFSIRRSPGVHVDGDLGEWSSAEWIPLGEERWFGDSYGFSTTLEVAQTPVSAQGNKFQGFSFTGLTSELNAKYGLEAYPHQSLVVITAVEPGSAADRAGLLPGDAVSELSGRTIKYEFQIWQVAESLRKAVVGKKISIGGRRSGRTLYGGEADLSASAAFMLDDEYLYFAAKVSDDVHAQSMSDSRLWMQDSVQIGLHPVLEPTTNNYGENDHEIGFALTGGEPLVWRWKGRRGQPVGPMSDVPLAVVRSGNVTTYEAAIPLAEIVPLAPDTWPMCGVDIVVNDTDEGDKRKGRLELAPGAMTHGKNPGEFAVFECAASPDRGKLSAALVWNKRCMAEGGFASLTLALRSPQTRRAVVTALLSSLDDLDTQPAKCERTVPVSADPEQHALHISSGSPPGRYKLAVTIESEAGQQAAAEDMNVYVYPR